DVAFPIPEDARKAGRFAVNLSVSTDLTAPWIRFPPHTWALRRDVRVGLPPLAYAAAALAALLLATGLVYLRIYPHPLVVRVAAPPGALKLFPLADLPAADRALRRARRLGGSLSVAGLSLARWQRALSADRLRSFAEALGASLGPAVPDTPP